jgi:lipoate-protein ligase A
LRTKKVFFSAVKPANTAYLVFYENSDAIVLGKSLNLADEVDLHKAVPNVYRRISGGGTVLHCSGILNYALFLSLADFPELFNVSLSYDSLLTAIAGAIGKKVAVRGYSDLGFSVRGDVRKFSGNAQCRKRGWLMLHGTLVYTKRALQQIPWYLKLPPKQPEYRAGRSHREFMTNVLPSYSRQRLMHNLRRGLARHLSARLVAAPPRDLPGFSALNAPFQPEYKSG